MPHLESIRTDPLIAIDLSVVFVNVKNLLSGGNDEEAQSPSNTGGSGTNTGGNTGGSTGGNTGGNTGGGGDNGGGGNGNGESGDAE